MSMDMNQLKLINNENHPGAGSWGGEASTIPIPIPIPIPMEAHQFSLHNDQTVWPSFPVVHNNLQISSTGCLLGGADEGGEEEEEEELGAVKEMMFKIAAMQPVDIDPATIRKPKRRNVRISDDPQSVAARLRRERISDKIRILQRLVPGGTKMDTASMLDEAIRYVKFLKRQIRLLQPPPAANNWPTATTTYAGNAVTASMCLNHEVIGD